MSSLDGGEDGDGGDEHDSSPRCAVLMVENEQLLARRCTSYNFPIGRKKFGRGCKLKIMSPIITNNPTFPIIITSNPATDFLEVISSYHFDHLSGKKMMPQGSIEYHQRWRQS